MSTNLYVTNKTYDPSKESSVFEMKAAKMYDSDGTYYFRMDKDFKYKGTVYYSGWSYAILGIDAGAFNDYEDCDEIDKKAFDNAPKEPLDYDPEDYVTEEEFEKIPKKSTSPKDLLKQECNEQEIEKLTAGKINWLSKDEKYYTTWKRIKAKNYNLNKGSEELYQLFGCNDVIVGKPQIRDDEKKTDLTLVTKASKNDKEGNKNTCFKFIDDYYNKRDDGYEEDTLQKSFWVYDVIFEGEKYWVFCDKKIENQEIHTFYGMKIKVPHKKEFDKNLSCRGSANFFFCKTAESTIKPIPKKDIINEVKAFISDNNVGIQTFKDMMFDYPFIHPDGKIYRHPKDYMKVRHSHFLSSKYDGSPLTLMVYSTPGLGKTIEAECTDKIFQESILEAGNSTPKVLIPSFKEKPANPGFILTRHRMAVIDELMKMLDNQKGNSRGLDDVKAQLGQLNMIIDHKKRTVGSGNDNTLTSQATAKTLIFSNPDAKSEYLHQVLDILDTSTFTRIMPWVKDKEHEDFIDKNKPCKCGDTYSIYHTKMVGEKENILYKGKVFAHKLRDFYVIIYDSCQRFESKVDENRVEQIFRASTEIAKNPLKSLWKRRGFHHTILMLDGLVKYRCIFEDFDDKFEATEKDYDDLERIMIRMVKSWDTYMGLEDGL